MNAKQFIIDVYERHAKAVENGYDLRMEESEWLEIMEEYADHKLDMARKNSGNFTNGSFTLKGVQLITNERSEQINKHGRTIEYDFQQNENGQLTIGAMMLLAVDFEEEIDSASYPQGWDHDLCDKMLAKNYKDRLVLAGALIAAEIDRIQFIPA